MFNTQQEAQNYALSLSPKQLVLLLNKLDNAYYNKSKSFVTDVHYDIIREVAHLRQNEDSIISQYLKKIGHKPIKSFAKLTYRMPSLNKIKPGTGEVAKFAKGKGQFVLIDKLDGVSILLDYEDGNLPNCFTRGTDDEGQDINRLRPHFNVPKSLGVSLAVRSEIIVPLTTFLAKYSQYENPRNMTIGVTSRTKGSDAIKDLHVVAYSILNKQFKPSKQLALLSKLGFMVPHYTVVDTISDDILSKYLAKRRLDSPYEIDGIVVHWDEYVSQEQDGNPKYSVAFKVTTSEETKEAVVLGIEWNVSKHKKINPIITIEPTKLKGVTISNITGNNAFFITHGYKYADSKINANVKPKPIGKGAVIRISRSGDVIPKVEAVLKSAKPNMPTVPYEWDSNGVAIYAVGDESDDNVATKKLLHFFTTLDVEGLKAANIKLLYDNGYTDAKSILTITKAELLSLPRIQETMASKLYSNIQKCLNVKIEKLADASGIFGEGMGERRAKLVFEAYPDILTFTKAEAYNCILSLSGFDVITTTKFTAGLQNFAKFCKSVNYKRPTQQKVGNSLKISVVFTGIRNSKVEEYIESCGGKIASGVTKDSTVLVAKDVNENSAKLTKARSLGIPIMTMQKFCSHYNVPIG